LIEDLHRAIEQLFGRVTGPMYFRLILQPLVSIALAIRAGLKDDRENKPAFLWELFKTPTDRRQLLHSAWKDIGRVIILAFILDTVYQLIVLKFFYPLQALIMTFLLAVLPYILLRGPVRRFSKRFKSQRSR
jgi:hypothetical protein